MGDSPLRTPSAPVSPLTEAKARPTWEWLLWLDENRPGKARSAQGYMRLYRYRVECASLAHSGVEGARRALAGSKRRQPARRGNLPAAITAHDRAQAASDEILLVSAMDR